MSNLEAQVKALQASQTHQIAQLKSNLHYSIDCWRMNWRRACPWSARRCKLRLQKQYLEGFPKTPSVKICPWNNWTTSAMLRNTLIVTMRAARIWNLWCPGLMEKMLGTSYLLLEGTSCIIRFLKIRRSSLHPFIWMAQLRSGSPIWNQATSYLIGQHLIMTSIKDLTPMMMAYQGQTE